MRHAKIEMDGSDVLNPSDPWDQGLNDATAADRSHILIRRLAYYIHLRAKSQHGAVKLACEKLGVSPETLRKYARYNSPNDASFGPIRMCLFLQLVEHFGDSPDKVLYAATKATNAVMFEHLINYELVAKKQRESFAVVEGLQDDLMTPSFKPQPAIQTT